MTNVRFAVCAVAFTLHMATTVPAFSQTTGSPYEPEIQSLVLEAKIDPANMKPLPPDFAAALSNAELRVRIDTWALRPRTYRFTLFLVAQGAPIPTTQLPALTSSTLIVQGVARAESINHAFNVDGPSVAIIGRVTQKLGGVGELDPGELLVLSFRFPDTAVGSEPVAIEAQNLTVFSPGDIVFWAPTAVGTMQVSPARVAGK